MPDDNVKDLYWQYFNCSGSYVLDYIIKFETQFRLTKIYDNNAHIASGCITEPNELYRIYVSSDNDLIDILFGFALDIDVDKFNGFSDLIEDLITELTRNRYPDRFSYEDDYYFVIDDTTRTIGAKVSDNLETFTNGFCEYVKPNSPEARMVIQWLILFKLCYNSSIDLEDINNFIFAYDEVKKDFHLFIWLKGNTNSRHFVFEKSDERRSILDITYWNEKEVVPKLKTFDLPLNTIVSEINKFRSNYTSIIVKGKTNKTDFEDVFRDIFKVVVNNESELESNLQDLEIEDNTEFTTTSVRFDQFAEDLKDIIDNITNEGKINTEWFFRSNNGHVEDYVSHFLNSQQTKYYTPRMLESRLVIAWIVVYKLCKHYDYELDRTKIENLAFYYYPRKDFLRIVITIDGKEHKFGMDDVRNRNVLGMFWWHECTECDKRGGCVYINKDEKDDIGTTYTAQDNSKESEELVKKPSDSREEVKGESASLTSFSGFLTERLVIKWDNAIKNYVRIEGNAFQTDFNVRAVIPLNYIPEEEYDKINDIIIEIYKLSGLMPIFTAYPKDYCDNYVSPTSFSKFDDDVLVDYDTIESTDFTSLMIILATLEYHWMTKKEVAEWDDTDHFIINKTTFDVFYKQGLAYVRHSIINVNNRIIEWYIPGSKDDKKFNQSGFGSIDSLALIKPTEQKNDKRKKLLKMMLISQIMNNSKK